jgi:hypothetical protein
MHDGLFYVSERNFDEMPIDDCVWIVFPDGFVARGIPVSNPIHPPTPADELRRRREALDIVYTPNSHFGVLFAERHTAEYYGKIARAVSDSTTWGEFRNALPPDVWDDVLSNRGDDEPDDDEPFPQEEFRYGYHDGWFIGGWPTEDELRWFPEDLIEKYGGSVDLTGPDYDQLYFPPGVADDIAEELRSRGHKVEKTETGDLPDWIDVVGAY